jgi:glucose-6-phosphate 1-epimerase
MESTDLIAALRSFEVPGVIAFDRGAGGLPRARVTTDHSAAEIYLHGAQVTGFRKQGEPPLLFLSRLSQFAPGKAIRGGVPICFPWFGPREGDVMHGFARVTEWQVLETAAAAREAATLRFLLPENAARAGWPPFQAELLATVGDRLTLDLIVTNRSRDRALEFENCLHSYFAVGDINQASLRGLKSAVYLDKTQGGVRKTEAADTLRIEAETNRVYLDATGPVEIHDGKYRRTIRIEKSGSASTVVWNPWSTQPLGDFAPEEHQTMLCVESGNVGPNRLSLEPGQTSNLRVILSTESHP